MILDQGTITPNPGSSNMRRPSTSALTTALFSSPIQIVFNGLSIWFEQPMLIKMNIMVCKMYLSWVPVRTRAIAWMLFWNPLLARTIQTLSLQICPSLSSTVGMETRVLAMWGKSCSCCGTISNLFWRKGPCSRTRIFFWKSEIWLITDKRCI